MSGTSTAEASTGLYIKSYGTTHVQMLALLTRLYSDRSTIELIRHYHPELIVQQLTDTELFVKSDAQVKIDALLRMRDEETTYSRDKI